MGITDLLQEVYALLNTIQCSHKGSIGTPNNVYLPQLPVKRVDDLAAQVVIEHLLITQTNTPASSQDQPDAKES